jgi:tRNA (adenine57-N1/adenine58-N1)-methyltransferase
VTSDPLIQENDSVLLYLSPRKNWIVRARASQEFHTHLGRVQLGNLVGLAYGAQVHSTTGEVLWALRPSLYDLIRKSERRTQVLYPKDLGFVAARTGLGPGQIVVEVGTGSGVLTAFAANLVRPTGHVYTFEARPEFAEVARRNLERVGLGEYVTLGVRDAIGGIGVTGADVALLDVGAPWELVPSLGAALKGSGMLAAICPTMNQIERLVESLGAGGFVDVESVELLLRSMEARTGMTRPSTRMHAHTAYLVFARKVLASA